MMWRERIVETRRNIDTWEETGRGGFGGFGATGVIELNWRARGIGHIWSPLDVPGLSETGRDVN